MILNRAMIYAAVIITLLLNASVLCALTPPGMPDPDIAVSDSVSPVNDLQILFGGVTEGNTSSQTVIVSNTGNADLVIGTIGLANGLAVPFSILNDTCSGKIVDPLGSCSFSIRFSPSAGGTFNDTFDIPSNDTDENPVIMSVSGTVPVPVADNPPSLPKLAYPANGQNDLGTTVEFRWEQSTDPDGENVNYDIYVCTDEDLTVGCITGTNIAYHKNNDIYYAGMGNQWAGLFLFGLIVSCAGFIRGRSKVSLLIVLTCMVAILMISCGGGGGGGGGSGSVTNSISTVDPVVNIESTYTVSTLSAGTTYYWQIVARDNTGAETSSPVWTFTTR